MPGPYDYTIQQPDISGSLFKGYEMGQKIGEQQAAADLQAQYKTDLTEYLQSPTADNAAAFIAKHPAQQKAISASFGIYNEAQKDDIFNAGTQAYRSILSGRPDIAGKIIDERIASAKNSGQDTKDLESLRQSLDQDPEATGAGLALTLSGLKPEAWSKMAPELRAAQAAPLERQKLSAEVKQKQAEAGGAAEKVGLENLKSRAEIDNIRSQVKERSARLDLDQDKLQSDVELKLNELGQKATTLDDGAKKLINDSAIASVAADQTAGQFLDLASQIDKLGGGYGAFATASEFLANATGKQDALSAARREYVRLRNTQAIKNLPPGAASDADVAMALEGFPKETADSKTLSSFLRGTAKLSQIEAVNENAKSEWVNSVGHLGKPKTDIEIDGVAVPKGTTYTEFAKKYVTEKAGQRGAQQAQQQVPQRSYMKYAQPAGGQ